MFRKFATIFGTLGIIALFIGVIVGMSMLRPKPERQEPQIAPPSVFLSGVCGELNWLAVKPVSLPPTR